MKEKHWYVWALFFFVISCYEGILAAKAGLSLSQSGISKAIIYFALGSIGTAIAFLWEYSEGPYVKWPKG